MSAMQRPANADLTFRHGSDADLPAILDLWVAAWAATMPEIDFAARRDWLAERQRTMVSEGAIILVGLSGETLVAYALVNPLTAYLDQIAVAPSQHGRGVARLILGEAQRLSPVTLSLHVNQKNPRAIGFYEREGFVRTGEGINPRSGLPIYFYTWTGKNRTGENRTTKDPTAPA